LFRRNPGFQLASILLVLFVAYVWQVKHQPYMSTVQRHEVILDHRQKVAQGDDLHRNISHKLKSTPSAKSLKEKAADEEKSRHRRSELEEELHLHDMAEERKRALAEKHKKREYFWDFNTVEQVLLSCAILVCLSGVMFESDRFRNDEANR
jgi:hypothetical protein